MKKRRRQGWICTWDRLPKVDQRVLAIDQDGFTRLAIWLGWEEEGDVAWAFPWEPGDLGWNMKLAPSEEIVFWRPMLRGPTERQWKGAKAAHQKWLEEQGGE